MPTEADARMVVDHLLKEAGWDIFNKAQVSTEEATSDGRADYVLKNSRSQPLCVVEAKRFSVDPYAAKGQAKDYAQGLSAPFILLSNGKEHYFWDYSDGDARPILGFPSPGDLERRANLRLHRPTSQEATLAAIPLPLTFRFKGEEVGARPYQLECMRSAERALVAGRRRMLFEMATGTGKTLTIAMLMKRWFQGAAISKVLFLADRIELAKQAKETFDDYLREFPCTILYGGRRSLQGQIVVGTLDTIASQLGPGGFGHAYFDLVVTDECHRSIYNTHRATLAHFDAIHIGLTATPNPGELRWISDHERQLVKSTYLFFDCWDSAKEEGRPTFAYALQDGIRDGYLASYKIYQAESRLTFEGAVWEDDEITFADWGRSAESEDRLTLIIQEFFRLEADRSPTRPRKTIVFAVSEKQAVMLERLFNKLLPDDLCLTYAYGLNRSPSEVRQSFAKKITCYSNNGNPKPIIDEFKYDPLPVVAVSVDMLDTGYDHKEVENLVMLRPTRSSIKYAQMRGRGSRLCPRIGKTDFLVYDFVDNTTQFNDPGETYHRPRAVGKRPEPGVGEGPEPGGIIIEPPPPPPPPPPREFLRIPSGSLEDQFRRRELLFVGPEGLAIDRKTYQDEWAKVVVDLQRTDPVVRRIFAGEEVTEEEWAKLAYRLDSPQFYFTQKSLQKAFDQPSGSLSDFIRAALGLYKFPSREERIERVFRTWVAEHSDSLRPEQAEMLGLLKSRVIAGDTIDLGLFSQPPFSLKGGLARMEQLFGSDGLTSIVDELNMLLLA